MSNRASRTDIKRVISPKRRTKLENNLIVLGNDDNKSDLVEAKPSRPSAGRRTPDRPSSGALLVLTAGKDLNSTLPNDRVSESGNRSNSSRVEYKLPSVKRKNEKTCKCRKACLPSSTCGTCSGIQNGLTQLRLHDGKFNKPNVSAVGVSSTVKQKEESVLNDMKMQGKQSYEDKAPLELIGRFLTAVMSKEFEEAKDLCDQILKLEPENPTCLEFKDVIEEKINQDDESDSSGEDDGESSENEESDEESNSGTESSAEDEEESDDEEINVDGLNLLMGGVPVRKITKR